MVRLPKRLRKAGVDSVDKYLKLISLDTYFPDFLINHICEAYDYILLYIIHTVVLCNYFHNSAWITLDFTFTNKK